MVRIRVPGDIDVKTRFFGQFTWKDLTRILVPTIGLGMLHPYAAAAGLAIGAVLYTVKPYGKHLDHHAYHALRHTIGGRTGTGLKTEATSRGFVRTERGGVVGGVKVSPTNLDLKSGVEQRAVLDTYRGLLEQARFPVHVISRQRPSTDGPGTQTDHYVTVRVDASHDSLEDELQQRLRMVEDVLTEGDLSADRASSDTIEELANTYAGDADRRSITNDWNEHLRVAYVAEHPSEVDLGWVRHALRTDGKVDIHQIIAPRDTRKTERQLKREKENLRAEIDSQLAGGFVGVERLNARLEDVEWMLDLLARREDRPVDAATYIAVRSPSEDEAQETFERVTARIRADVQEPVYRMDRAMKTLSPVHPDALKEAFLMPTRSAAAAFPFCTQDTQEPGGVVYGVDCHDETPVLLNRWNWKAPHMVRMGATGSGKSYGLKLELLRQADRIDDLQVYVIDPKQEYGDIITSLDGVTYTLDAPLTEADTLPLLDEAKAASFQVAERGAAENTERLVDAVRFLYQWVSRDDRRTLLVVDEAHNLLEDAEGSRVLKDVVREARDTNTAVTLVTQNASDFTSSTAGRKLLKNVQATLFMQHEQVEDSTRQFFRLSDFETQELYRLKTGTETPYSEAVLRVGKRLKTKIRIEASHKEESVIEKGSSEHRAVARVSDHVPEKPTDHNEEDAEKTRSEPVTNTPPVDRHYQTITEELEELEAERTRLASERESTEEEIESLHTERDHAASTVDQYQEQLHELEEKIEARQQEIQTLEQELHETKSLPDNPTDLERALPPLPEDWLPGTSTCAAGPIPSALEQRSANYYAPDGTRYTVIAAHLPPHEFEQLQDEPLDIRTVNAWASVDSVLVAAVTNDGTKQNAGNLVWRSPLIEAHHNIDTYA